MVSEKQSKRSKAAPALIDERIEDSDMWLFEHYEKERLRSIGVVE